jgi:hypothetical protein
LAYSTNSAWKAKIEAMDSRALRTTPGSLWRRCAMTWMIEVTTRTTAYVFRTTRHLAMVLGVIRETLSKGRTRHPSGGTAKTLRFGACSSRKRSSVSGSPPSLWEVSARSRTKRKANEVTIRASYAVRNAAR